MAALGRAATLAGAVLMVGGLSACATTETTASHEPAFPTEDVAFFHAAPPKRRIMDSMALTWLVVGNVDGKCKSMMQDPEKLANRYVWGCAVMSVEQKTCTVVTGVHTHHAVLGHEVRHCFEGAFHK